MASRSTRFMGLVFSLGSVALVTPLASAEPIENQPVPSTAHSTVPPAAQPASPSAGPPSLVDPKVGSNAAESTPNSGKAVQRYRVLRIPVPEPPLRTQQQRHALFQPLQYAYVSLTKQQEQIRDYRCVYLKRERLSGVLRSYQWGQLKVRNPRTIEGQPTQPLSIYLRFDGPVTVAGREMLYVAGQNDGNMYFKRGGSGPIASVPFRIRPLDPAALFGNRRPVTEVGLLHLTRRLIEDGFADLTEPDLQVRFEAGAKINGRSCVFLEVTYPDRAEIGERVNQYFFDEESQLPIRHATFRRSLEPPNELELIAEYNYLQLETNVGLTDEDFDERNPDYGFR